jgi:hypothetical protein
MSDGKGDGPERSSEFGSEVDEGPCMSRSPVDGPLLGTTKFANVRA